MLTQTGASTTAGATDSALYKFALSVGARTLPRAPKSGIRLLMNPIEYIRCAEARYVAEHLDVRPGARVLDVGSPKLLSLFLAAKGAAEVHATDLVDYFFERYAAYTKTAMREGRGQYQMRSVDARSLTYADGFFDRAFSISAIEHIPGDGDSLAMKELGRVLKPGGIACLTVPWSDRGYLEEYADASNESVYCVKERKERIFNYRAYDRPSLFARLVEPGPFELVDLSFWGERRIPVEDWIQHHKLPRPVRWALLPAHFPLSRIFLRQLGEDEPSHKKVACLTLRRIAS